MPQWYIKIPGVPDKVAEIPVNISNVPVKKRIKLSTIITL